MMQEKLKQVADKLGASLMKGFGCSQYLVFGDPANPESLKLLVYPSHDGKHRVAYLNSQGTFFDEEGSIKHSPTVSHYRQTVDSINVSLDRKADALANDINRRILQPVLAVHAANIKHCAEYKVLEVEYHKRLGALGLPPEQTRGQVWRGPDMARAEVTESSYEDVTIRLRWIRHSLALKLIKFLEENGQ